MLNNLEITKNRPLIAVCRLFILFILCVLVFWPLAVNMIFMAPTSSEMVHILVVPVAIGLLIFRRRLVLAEGLTKGSAWGVLLLLAGLALYSLATWPFAYGYAADMALIPVLAGLIVVSAGWRILKLSFPMLLLVLLSIPMGSRLYATLIIRPETYTIACTAAVLEKLPGINTWVNGTDLFFTWSGKAGVVGLGQSHRGVRLLLVFAVVGLFVTFSQIGTLRRLVTVAVLSIPIIFFCNFIRFLCWGLVVIYGGTDYTGIVPQTISAVCSLLACYGLFGFACSARVNLFVDFDEQAALSDSQERTNAEN